MDIWLFDGTTLHVYFFYALIYVLVQYTLFFFYLRSLSRLLKVIQPGNRRLEPGLVWIGMIPGVNLLWPFVMNPLICSSVKKEMESRGIDEYGDYGMALGIISPLLAFGGFVPYVGRLINVAGLITWCLFWVKMNEYRKRLDDAGAKQHREDLLDS